MGAWTKAWCFPVPRVQAQVNKSNPVTVPGFSKISISNVLYVFLKVKNFKGKIKIVDTSPECFKAMLEYFYCGEIDKSILKK